MTPTARREAVAHLRIAFEVSERRACSTLGADRTSIRYRSRRRSDAVARARLRELAKSSGVTVFLIGHVTKEGTIAGPRVLEHIVDTVLYLEGEHFQSYRLLRSVKNRFGATSEVGVFEMQEKGMVEVRNPSEVFLSERMINAPGSAIAVTM